MSEFKVIETQEQLNAVIGDRVNRAQESVRKSFEGWISPDDYTEKTKGLNGQITSLTSELDKANKDMEGLKNALAERDTTIRAYETASVKAKIAQEYGLSYGAIDFLKGEDEDSIRKSAESLKGLIGSNKTVPPLKSTETPGADKSQEAYRAMANKLK